MKYIRTMTQQKLSFWLALYIGWFMNVAVFFRRFDGYAQEFTFWKGLSGVVELVATVFVTFFLLRLLSLFGRRIWRILATLIVLFSSLSITRDRRKPSRRWPTPGRTPAWRINPAPHR